jgi:hypothetical protein
MKNLTDIDRAYIAGFFDGDGSLICQIVKSSKHKLGFYIRISIVFIQRTDKHWFLMNLRDMLKYGSLRKRKDGISEYTIVSGDPVRLILLELLPYLKIKRSLALHVLKIIECKRNINNDRELFIEACSLVDRTITMTYSKKRTITKETVIKYLDSIKHR